MIPDQGGNRVGTYLVTGGTGNQGTFVTKELARRGDQVVAYDLMPNPRALERVLTQEELERTTLVPGDILDLERVIYTLKSHRVEGIVHLAAAACEQDPPTHGIRINVIGTNNMFEAALIAGVQRVLFATSGAVWGPKSVRSDGVLPGDAPYDPEDLYGATKATNEIVARHYTAHYGLDIVGMRPAAYGPVAVRSTEAVNRDPWIADLIEDILHGRPGIAIGGRGIAPWLYVEDMAQAWVAALKVNPSPNTILDAPVGFPGTNDDVIEIIRREAPDASITVLPDDRPPADWNYGRTPQVPDDDPTVKLLGGWKPTIDPEAGVRKIFEYHRTALAAGSSST
jgi:UDP-glucose 4-epimerase